MNRRITKSTSGVHIVSRMFAAAIVGLISAGTYAQPPIESFLADAPANFIPPPIHPAGAQLQTKQLGDGVYALLSGLPAVDNSGFIVGERGVLVIDAHVNAEMAGQIQDAVRRVTDKPILYLINTNYHGDHTFGNYAFPKETLIVAHRNTAEHMQHFELEKEFMLPTVDGDRSVFSDAELRLPDIAFDKYLRLDLGGRFVELHYFGRGNTPGDTVVFEPHTRTAWTGNLVVGAGTIPPMFEGGVNEYLQTISRFAQTLEVTTIIPGHGAPATADILGRYLRYLSDLKVSVRGAIDEGKTADVVIASLPLGAEYLPPRDAPQAALIPFLQGLHSLNVHRTYRDLTAR
ncbi:MAG: MBL fold metallo-hydrolase [Phycisphaerales bacterium]